MVVKKAGAYILCCCIALLMAHPASWQQSFQATNGAKAAKSCCKRPSAGQKPRSNDCCEKGHCNPFAACSCCAAYTIAAPFELKPHQVFAETQTFHAIASQNQVSQYLSDCWHPPEIV